MRSQGEGRAREGKVPAFRGQVRATASPTRGLRAPRPVSCARVRDPGSSRSAVRDSLSFARGESKTPRAPLIFPLHKSETPGRLLPLHCTLYTPCSQADPRVISQQLSHPPRVTQMTRAVPSPRISPRSAVVRPSQRNHLCNGSLDGGEGVIMQCWMRLQAASETYPPPRAGVSGTNKGARGGLRIEAL